MALATGKTMRLAPTSGLSHAHRMPALLASAILHPSPWMVLPFALLLLCIAVAPMVVAHHWERHYPKVAVTLGLITAGYYYFGLGAGEAIAHALQEYISFMALVGSLYVISGGINIGVKGEATPLRNTLFLLMGAVLANIIGTTGASMLFIRPWIRMNRHRITGFHIVFFIFIVSNVGGCLTPVGDPPLFLGFLRGVPFWWVLQHCWQAWALVLALLLGMFYALDARHFLCAPKQVRHEARTPEKWSFKGLPNLLFLAVVLSAVFIDPGMKLGIFTLASVVMIVAAAASYFTTRPEVHEANYFNFHPVKEVGWLFIGIFLTMLPALDLLKGGEGITLRSPLQYYFACGGLSAFLDNAPTYLTFLATEMGAKHLDVGNSADVRIFVAQHPAVLVAISLGAVFFGAGTYIGNGPNFMVKAIAEKARVKVPGFLSYLLGYSLPFLLPVLIAVGWLLVR
ncbi:MAG: Citrate transporter [Verrucomicrobiaceae bacterium]|nr:Citrate transporter [Verrucomicrobiaceae bacterium]